MIHACLSKLHCHLHSDHFRDVLRQTTAYQDEGLQNFELDLLYLTKEEKEDLIFAFHVLGYDVEVDEEERCIVRMM